MSKQRLSQERIQELLEGAEDVLTPMAKKEEAMLKRVPCQNCGSKTTSVEPNTKNPFSVGSPLANKLIRCLTCGTTFDPFSKIFLSPPTAE